MRLQSIDIQGLFGLYDHHIPLNLEERVTILYGPNGVGKTRVLDMLDVLFSPERREDLPELEQLELRFEDSSTLVLQPSPTQPFGMFKARSKGAASAHVNQGDEVGYFGVAGSGPEHIRPHWWLGATGGLQSVFIPTQRISRNPVHSSPDLIAKRLQHQLTSHEQRYSALAQDLDASYPRRLLQPSTEPLPSREELQARLDALHETQRRLKELGLLDQLPVEIEDLSGVDAGRLAALAIHMEDTTRKLAVFAELIPRLERLRDTLGRRFLHKRLEFSREEGLRFISARGEEIPLNVLSSGEQHELILLYTLLFDVGPGTLVLLDEPELSLHLSWQREFMQDLVEIAQLNGFDAIVATHSAQIVGSYRHLLVELKGELSTRAA